ncbi:Two-component response regulator ORR24, partial [Mucuna pruriens]
MLQGFTQVKFKLSYQEHCHLTELFSSTSNFSLALDKLRKHRGYFQLIVTEVHTPDLDGFKLKQIVDEEFAIPIIMISADNSEEIQQKAITSGVMRYIFKPAKPDDFVVAVMKGEKQKWEEFHDLTVSISYNSNVTAEDSFSTRIVGDIIEETSGGSKHHKEASCSSFIEEESRDEQKSDDIEPSSMDTSKDNGSTAPKKTKMIWTKELQNKFVKAIDIIGKENAIPKKILKVMNVEGLTRENVASHLQKYRLYLRRVERILVSVIKKANEDNDVFLSKIASAHSSLVLKLIQEDLEKNVKQNKRRSLEYLESNNIYISHLRSKLSSWLLSNPEHYCSFKMNPYVKMSLPSDKTNNLGITNNTTKPYHPYLNVNNVDQPRSASNLVQNIYNESSQNTLIRPSELGCYNFNKHGLGQVSNSNVVNCNAVTSFQGRCRSSQIQLNEKWVPNPFDLRYAIVNDRNTNNVASVGMWKPNSTSLVGGVVSTTGGVYSTNQNLPISMGGTNIFGNIVMGGNLIQPQQQHQTYNQEYNQTFATVDNNFASQVTSNGSHFKGIDHAFSMEEYILNKVPMQDKNKSDDLGKESIPSNCTMHVNTAKAKAFMQARRIY